MSILFRSKEMSALRLYRGNKIIFFIRYLHVKSSLSYELYFLMKFLCSINFFGSIKLYHKIHWNIFSCFSRRFYRRLSDGKKFLSPRNPTWIPFIWYDKNIVLRDLRNTSNSLAVSASQQAKWNDKKFRIPPSLFLMRIHCNPRDFIRTVPQ